MPPSCISTKTAIQIVDPGEVRHACDEYAEELYEPAAAQGRDPDGGRSSCVLDPIMLRQP